MQRVDLRIDQRTRLLEVSNRRLAVAVPVLENGEHGVCSRFTGTPLQDPIEQRHGAAAAGFIVKLSGALERRHVVQSIFNARWNDCSASLAFAHACERDALQRPELWIVRRLPQCRSAVLDGLLEVPGAEGGRDRIDLVDPVVAAQANRQHG